MQIDWWTFGFQLVNFVVLVWLLSRFLYKPVRDVIERRAKEAGQALAEADAAKAEAEALKAKLAAERAALVEERQQALKSAHEAAEAQARETLAKAQKDADALLAAGRATLAEERKSAAAALREQAAGLAGELAATLLRKAGQGEDAGALAALEQRLKGLPAEERDRLDRELAADGAVVTVAAAAALTSKQRARWSDMLSKALPRTATIEFAVDPELLGGAELRFPHAVIGYTWADQARQAEEMLARDDKPS